MKLLFSCSQYSQLSFGKQGSQPKTEVVRSLIRYLLGAITLPHKAHTCRASMGGLYLIQNVGR